MHERRRALRVRRAALDLTQFEAAQKAGLTLNRWSRIETCMFDPTPAEQKRIAKALKSSIADLFGAEKVSA